MENNINDFNSLYQDLKNIFKKHGLLEWDNWHKIDGFNHTCNKSKKEFREFIERPLGKKSGLYAYFNSDGECLYIGKAKYLKNRITDHYIESQSKTDEKKYWKFFRSNKEGINMKYFILGNHEKEGEALRVSAERILHINNKIKFDEDSKTWQQINTQQ